jgi:hypothetical protein
VHPLIPSVGSNSQQIDANNDDRSHTAATVAPAALISSSWKQSSPSSSPSSSSRRSDHRRDIAADQNLPEARRSSPPCTPSPAISRRNPSKVSRPSPFKPRPSDLDPTTLIESLNERVSLDLHRSDRIKSNGSESQSDRTGILQSEAAMCRLTI